MHGNRRLEVDSLVVTVPGGGEAFGPCPSKANHRGPTYLLPPKPKPGLLGPLGPLAKVDFYQVSRPRGTDRAPREESGLYRTNPGPAGWARKTNQGPARQTRARRTNQGSARQIRARRTNQGPAGQIKDHGTDQGLAIRIGAPRDGSGPRTSNQGPHDESGPRGTRQSPARRMRAGRTK